MPLPRTLTKEKISSIRQSVALNSQLNIALSTGYSDPQEHIMNAGNVSSISCLDCMFLSDVEGTVELVVTMMRDDAAVLLLIICDVK